jgi:hypothetical protein
VNWLMILAIELLLQTSTVLMSMIFTQVTGEIYPVATMIIVTGFVDVGGSIVTGEICPVATVIVATGVVDVSDSK